VLPLGKRARRGPMSLPSPLQAAASKTRHVVATRSRRQTTPIMVPILLLVAPRRSLGKAIRLRRCRNPTARAIGGNRTHPNDHVVEANIWQARLQRTAFLDSHVSHRNHVAPVSLRRFAPNELIASHTFRQSEHNLRVVSIASQARRRNQRWRRRGSKLPQRRGYHARHLGGVVKVRVVRQVAIG